MNTRNLEIAMLAFDQSLDRLARLNRNCGSNIKVYTYPPIKQTIDADCYEDDEPCKETSTIDTAPSFEDIIDDVQHVIYNDPATIVTFSDGTKVCVKACEKDTFNKETGLIYALVKRLYANDIDEDTGYLVSRGLGEKINKIVKNAVDQKENEKIKRAERKAKKEKRAALEAEKAKLANEVSEQAAKEAVEQVYDNAENK